MLRNKFSHVSGNSKASIYSIPTFRGTVFPRTLLSLSLRLLPSLVWFSKHWTQAVLVDETERYFPMSHFVPWASNNDVSVPVSHRIFLKLPAPPHAALCSDQIWKAGSGGQSLRPTLCYSPHTLSLWVHSGFPMALLSQIPSSYKSMPIYSWWIQLPNIFSYTLSTTVRLTQNPTNKHELEANFFYY